MKKLNSYKCEIILPIHNGLTYAKECIDSIISCTDKELYHLIIIDDCSDNYVAKYLTSILHEYNNITLIRNKSNIGFLKSYNNGIKYGQAKYVLLISSDVVVVDGWLERMITCANSDKQIASVNPLMNYASHNNIPITPGANFISMDWYIQHISQKRYPDVVCGVEFCMLLRRTALEEVGIFDEMYGYGYFEEYDLCMRLTTNGYRTVIADDVYVFHKGSASFKDRSERYRNNRRIFDQRWLKVYTKQFNAFQKSNPLGYLRSAINAPQRWAPLTSMRETYREVRKEYRDGNYLQAAKSAIKGVLVLPRHTEDVVSSEYISRFTRPKRLRVTYVLHKLTVAGGVLSVVQLVNELCLLGIEARIVTLYQYPETREWKLYSRPVVFKNEMELVNNFPETDIAVATHWTTAAWVSKVVKSGKANKAVYYLQDYESWFFPKKENKVRKKVKDTYDIIENKIVKSTWLQNLLQNDGYESKKIWLGLDLGVFYPRDVKRSSNPTIVAMARPRTPRRGFPILIDALSKVKAKRKHIDIILFGDDLSRQSIPFDYIDKGVIYDQNQLAELYSIADIFIDASDFQGFGRTGLEAMACQTTCILTNIGGVNEYARDQENCLLVPPGNPEEIEAAVIKLLDDDELRESLLSSSTETAKQFCHKREAKETLEFFNSLQANNV